jgi:hypothetical protein
MQEKKSDAAFSFIAPRLSKGEALYLIAEKKRMQGVGRKTFYNLKLFLNIKNIYNYIYQYNLI